MFLEVQYSNTECTSFQLSFLDKIMSEFLTTAISCRKIFSQETQISMTSAEGKIRFPLDFNLIKEYMLLSLLLVKASTQTSQCRDFFNLYTTKPAIYATMLFEQDDKWALFGM